MCSVSLKTKPWGRIDLHAPPPEGCFFFKCAAPLHNAPKLLPPFGYKPLSWNQSSPFVPSSQPQKQKGESQRYLYPYEGEASRNMLANFDLLLPRVHANSLDQFSFSHTPALAPPTPFPPVKLKPIPTFTPPKVWYAPRFQQLDPREPTFPLWD